ncbi:MAG: LpxI family protein [Halanaerobium sp. MSAO_Bac5]|nr:MAG: LpxI family protein [Halanaerobium sp. MSAO_Bac5]
MAKIALLAGWGDIPRLWAERAEAQGKDFMVIKIAEEITADFSDLDCKEQTINLADFNLLLELLKKDEVKKLILLGKIHKEQLFKNFEADLKLKMLLASLPNFNDDTILKALVDQFEELGIEVLPQHYLLEELLAKRGILAGNPSAELKKELAYAFKTAYNLGRFDIGQTALVKDRAVMALEAVEGTDEAIKRAAKYGGPGFVMGKCSKKEQDFRFDIPTVGLNTLELLLEHQAAGLVIEAEKTFMLDQAEFCRRAEKEGLVVAAASFVKGELILNC